MSGPDERTALLSSSRLGSDDAASSVTATPPERDPDWAPSRGKMTLGHTLAGSLSARAHMARRHAALKVNKPKVNKQVMYDPRLLTSWGVLRVYRATVFEDPDVQQMMGILVLVALATGLFAYLTVPSIQTMNAEAFMAVVFYIKVFIAFMIGMFLQNCVARWWSTVCSLTDLFLCVRKIAWFCNAFQVPQESRNVIQRHAVLSCLLLEAEVSSLYEPAEVVADRWARLQQFLRAEGLASDVELERLNQDVDASDRAMAVWAWIGYHIGTLKLPPPVQTCVAASGSAALACIKDIKTSVMLQMPLMYTHMLAFLVHLNNAMLAVATGLSIAVTVSVANRAVGPGLEDPDRPGRLYRSMQDIFVALLSVLVQPVIYHAFLQIGAILADPFTHESHGLPMLDYVQQLRQQLKEMNAMADEDVSWLMENAPSGDISDKRFYKVVRDAVSQRRGSVGSLSPRKPSPP